LIIDSGFSDDNVRVTKKIKREEKSSADAKRTSIEDSISLTYSQEEEALEVKLKQKQEEYN
jgi:hypothetical protein